jgi:HAD superfamily hydrolase (TIGR01509 family)
MITENAAIQALVFDFDGLILDTETPIFQSWQEMYRAYGLELPLELWVTNIGTAEEPFDPLTELVRQSSMPLDHQEIAARRMQRELELIQDHAPLPGVVDYLQDAQSLGLKVGIASSSSCRWVSGHLERLGLIGYFNAIVAKDDVPVTKPDPTLYRAILEKLDVAPERAVAFEDSPNGILAARRAGLFCVAVPNVMTRYLPIDHADLRLDSLAEMTLEDLLHKIGLKVMSQSVNKATGKGALSTDY